MRRRRVVEEGDGKGEEGMGSLVKGHSRGRGPNTQTKEKKRKGRLMQDRVRTGEAS